MAVASRIGSEETVSSKYVVPLVYLSSDEEEGMFGEARSCGRKAKSDHIGLQSPVATETIKRMKFCKVSQTAAKKRDLETRRDKLNTNDVQKTREPTAPIIIDISDDSSA
ncbi:hypothetical protein F511_34050 [Dorcoceras hygrometricum]|uniref:Uncharacterized protein n=1 Tax=Dorcoceras hygrometricum TaxID=472368 RepID=A0A2Z7ALG0_9LAMI|nr:hypothetical protein F511_34050 [Dorcoceras hygrometricum]